MRKSSILVIEDAVDLALFWKRLLRAFGYEVVLAADGREALELLRSGWRPDLIITDWMMPGMTGEEFLVVKEQEPGICDLPVIVVSAIADRLSLDRFNLKAAFRKPIEIPKVAHVIARAVEESCPKEMSVSSK